jgi:hypothetical protein
VYYKGTDWTYPFDNPRNREALDYAYDHGCLTVKGTADNMGRRAAAPESAFDVVFAVGSANRRDEPADICSSADYVEVGAPGGQRHSKNEADRVWGYGGDRNYIPFTGGCMAAGFGSGVAAPVWARFPKLTNEQLRQVLRNKARPARGVQRPPVHPRLAQYLPLRHPFVQHPLPNPPPLFHVLVHSFAFVSSPGLRANPKSAQIPVFYRSLQGVPRFSSAPRPTALFNRRL